VTSLARRSPSVMSVNSAFVSAVCLASSAYPAVAEILLHAFRERDVSIESNDSKNIPVAISHLRHCNQYASEVVQILGDSSSLERLEMMMTDPRIEQQAQQAAGDTLRLLQDPSLSRQWKQLTTDPDFQSQACRIANQMTQELLGDPRTLPRLRNMMGNADFRKHVKSVAERVAQVMAAQSQGGSEAPLGSFREGHADPQGASEVPLPPSSLSELGASQLKWAPSVVKPSWNSGFGLIPAWSARKERGLARMSSAGGLHSGNVFPVRGRARLAPSMSQTGGADPISPEKDMDSGIAAAGLLASSAVISEAVQLAGTAALLSIGQQLAGTNNPVETVAALIEYIKGLGVGGYGVFAVAMVTLQVVPVAAAFILTVSAGAMFGAVKGTALVLSSSTLSATISFMIARNFGRTLVLDAAKDSKQFVAIDKAFRNANFRQALTVVTLLRLSPVLPFAWANYVFGLTPVPKAAFSFGTLLGCLPSVAAYVAAGRAGANVAINGPGEEPLLLALGGAATFGAISLTGRVATRALKEADIDIEEEEPSDQDRHRARDRVKRSRTELTIVDVVAAAAAGLV